MKVNRDVGQDVCQYRVVVGWGNIVMVVVQRVRVVVLVMHNWHVGQWVVKIML